MVGSRCGGLCGVETQGVEGGGCAGDDASLGLLAGSSGEEPEGNDLDLLDRI